MAGEDAGEQAGRGAGVAEFQHVGGLVAAADAETAHAPQGRVALMGDLCAQRPERRGRGQHVLALQQAAHRGLAQGQGAEDQGPV